MLRFFKSCSDKPIVYTIVKKNKTQKSYGVASVSRIDKIQVPFAEYGLFYRSLLQKRPVILSILLTVATP